MMTDDDAGGKGLKMELFWMTSFVNDPLVLNLTKLFYIFLPT